jgi:DNA polymerase-3 subunit beta
VTIEHKPEERRSRSAADSASYRLHTYNAEDFPRLPRAEARAARGRPRDACSSTVARVSRSASRDESRPVLTGVLMRFEPASS